MNAPNSLLKNKDGAIMILLAMLILALLTIISFSASRTANTETLIAKNEYLYQKNFYCAEGAVIETLDRLQSIDSVDPVTIDWLMNETDDVDRDTKVLGYWTDDDRNAGDASPEAATVCAEHAELMSVHHGVIAGDSIDMSKPTKHAFSIYGYSHDRGSVMIKVGYVKAY